MRHNNQAEYSESQISFMEHADPIDGDIAVVVMDRPGGRKAVVAHVREEFRDGRKMYSACDTEGKMIIPPTSSLELLKKDIRKKEQFFHEQETLKEQALQQDFTEEERRRHRELRQLRSTKVKSQSRTR